MEPGRIWKQALAAGTAALSAFEDPELARLEAEILLCHELGVSRAQLYAHLDSSLTQLQEQSFADLIRRRLRREPVAYIVGHREFFGLDLYVDRRVLIPRPETELLVERALNWLRRRGAPSGGWRIADVGVGSGAIAVSLAIHVHNARIVALDASEGALQVARANCERHGVAERVSLLQGDLLSPVAQTFHLIVANLPYVKREELRGLSPDVRDYEPLPALDGGDDGLDLYRRLLRQAPSYLEGNGVLLAEIGADQGEAMLRLAQECFPDAGVLLHRDYAGLDRVVQVEMTKRPSP